MKEDLEALRELKDDLYRVCTRAKERGVKIIIDAEHRFVELIYSTYSGLANELLAGTKYARLLNTSIMAY